jgi:nucleotide-binding universal stress UspA family protein
MEHSATSVSGTGRASGGAQVVAGVDGSEDSLFAVEWAAAAALRRGVPLRVVAAPAPLPRLYAVDISRAAASSALRGLAARALATAISRAQVARGGLAIQTDLLTGPAPLAVTATGAGAVMLVLGARGAGGFATMRLGAVSRYAAGHATCPVVVLREAPVRRVRDGGGEIVVGIGDPEDGDDALAFALEEAASRNAELVAVHAWSGADQPPPAEQQLAEQRLTEALGLWRDKYAGVPVRHEVVHGHPAAVLARCSARADLVVLGRNPGPDVASIQHAVLDHAHGPVAIVPSGR